MDKRNNIIRENSINIIRRYKEGKNFGRIIGKCNMDDMIGGNIVHGSCEYYVDGMKYCNSWWVLGLC